MIFGVDLQAALSHVVAECRKALMRAIEGLGQHGLMGTSEKLLMNLDDAIGLQIQSVQKGYAEALSKLDVINTSSSASL